MTTRSSAPEATAWSNRPVRASLRLRGRWLMVARATWISLTGLSLLVLVVALPIFFETLREAGSPGSLLSGQLASKDVRLLEQWGVSLDVYAFYQTALIGLFALVFMTAGVLLFWRRSDNRIALFVSLWFVLIGTTGTPLLMQLIQDHPSWQLPATFLSGASIGCLPIFTYLFPDGRFVPGWTRGLTIAWLGWIVVSPFTPLMVADQAGPSAFWFGMLVPVGIGIGIFAQVKRYLHVSSPAERQQTRLLLFGVGVVAAGFLLYALLPLLPFFAEPGPARVLSLLFSETFLLVLPLWLLLLCIGSAILRHQLWDIDQLINRTLVYGALSIGVVGIYALLVGLLSALFHSITNPAIALIASVLAALLFQPLHTWLRRRVNRLMYGERDDPYTVLSRLGQQLKTTLAPHAVLPSIAETIAKTLKLPYVVLALAHNDRLEIAAVYGRPVGEPVRLPLVYRAEVVGQLLVTQRAVDEAFTPAERRLLEEIAVQAGVAAHAVRLTAELQRSRERLVTAREEERRRLRRDLHDGLGPQLASLTLTIAAARELLHHDVSAAEMLLQELASHTQAAITDVRRVVYDLRPPALDDLGLVLALREQAARYRQAGTEISIDAPPHLPPLPAAVEVAAYRIVQEALTNVLRHARARSCSVRFRLSDALLIEIHDDGIGLPDGVRAGVGLASMRERAAELGGQCQIESSAGRGTSIHVRLPLHQEEP